MRRVLTPAEMRRADARAIESGTPAEVLMDRAGRAVARAALGLAGGRYGKRALVVCGKGNNGGDGFVAARQLARAGVAVTCMTTFAAEEASGAARHHLDTMRRAGVPARPFDADADAARHVDVVVDAIFGTGFRGVPEGVAAEAIRWINDLEAPVVAVDIPSGVDGTTGGVGADATRATVTVALAAEKTGTVLIPGRQLAGEVEVVDIGIDPDVTPAAHDADDAAGAAPG
ncbi:MAG TPA: NAD(P)H-hydrate epimerase, partial [Actinomycetota bacterium]|nr:NAD(P)H-hydrate epimerase [Actinomycetota bacterium]